MAERHPPVPRCRVSTAVAGPTHETSPMRCATRADGVNGFGETVASFVLARRTQARPLSGYDFSTR